MKRIFILWITTLPVLVVLDITWTTLIAGGLYRSQLGALLTTQPQVIPLVLFYLIYALGLAYFVVAPALPARSWRMLFFGATLLGLVSYGTYDLVSLGINANWPTLISVVDICWGMVISNLTSIIVYLFARKFYKF